MFTGIIQAIGTVCSMEGRGDGARISIDGGRLDLSATAVGDSIAVNGVCLTAVTVERGRFAADVSAETLSRTTFSSLAAGARVNLELALTPTTRLGGHMVSGHVDGTGKVLDRHDASESVKWRIRAPAKLAKYIAEKGSICVDGVSLTVNAVDGAVFSLNIVPHTLRETTFGELRPGGEVNLEMDIIARYLERLLLGDGAAESGSAITKEYLEKHGFGG